MAEDILIKIGADVDLEELQKELDKVQKQFGLVGKSADGLGKGTDKLGKGTNKATGGFKKLKTSAGTTGIALTNLNRVIQDLPFGFLGIANNIDPLVASFQNLSDTTGGSRAALQTMIGALTGPAGLLFAVSTATSLFLVFGDKVKDVFSGIGRTARKTAQDIKKDIDEILDLSSLKPLGVKFDSPVQLAEAEVIAKKELEQINKDIVASNEKLLELTNKQQQSSEKFQGERANVDAEEARLALLKDRRRQYEALLKIFEEEKTDLVDLGRLTDILVEKLGATRIEEAFEGPLPDKPESILVPGPSATILPDKNKFALGPPPGSGSGIFKEQESELDKIIIKLAEVRAGIEEGLFTPAEGARREFSLLQQQLVILAANGVIGFDELKERLNLLREETKGATEDFTIGGQLFAEGVSAMAGSFADFILGFESIEELVDAFKDVENIVEGIGTVLIQVGNFAKSLIRDIAAAAARAAVLAALFPGASAAQGGFKGLFKGFLGLASGGIVTGPTTALIGEAGPEAVIPLDRLNSLMGAGTVQLEGTSLRFDGNQFLIDIRQAENTRGVGF